MFTRYSKLVVNVEEMALRRYKTPKRSKSPPSYTASRATPLLQAPARRRPICEHFASARETRGGDGSGRGHKIARGDAVAFYVLRSRYARGKAPDSA